MDLFVAAGGDSILRSTVTQKGGMRGSEVVHRATCVVFELGRDSICVTTRAGSDSVTAIREAMVMSSGDRGDPEEKLFASRDSWIAAAISARVSA